MANDGQVVFEVSADGSTALQQMRQLTRDIQHETEQWDDAAEESTENIGNSFTSMLKKVGSAIAAAKIGQKLLEIGKEAVDLASDLQEVQNVVDVTFGSDAGKIDAWAKNAATQFGLTETQAKKFTSTLGAMMKSSGFAGKEITDMSTDLAGLAADMASFYNLDFETAFQKIRSGISGETEPLKQLGINMSVANLNAFALKQGLSKTFEQMSQGEQIMLRYQYMMEATADAQGDFARTSDGYANSVRLLETNLTSLKTNLGNVLLDVINPLVSGLNELFPENWTRPASPLDTLAEIDIQTQQKIEDIKVCHQQADELTKVLEKLAQTNADEAMKRLATGANTLDSNSPDNWKAVMGALKGIDGLDNLFGENSNTDTIEELAKALSGNGVSTTKAQAWQTFLGALSNNADAVSKLTGTSADETRKWLEDMATAAGELDPEDAASWNTLMSSLVSGVNLDTEEGRTFVEQLAQQFLAMGKDSDEAVNGLAALGFSTDEISAKQEAWLETCKELVKTIPGLSSIIDTNTGEIKGGVDAVREYADEWERTATYQAQIEALQKKKQTYEEMTDPGELETSKAIEYAKARGRLIARGYAETQIDAMFAAVDKQVEQLAQGKTPVQGAGEIVSLEQYLHEIDEAYQRLDKMGSQAKETYRKDYGWKWLEWIDDLDDESQEAVFEYIRSEYALQEALFYRPLVLAEIEKSQQKLAEEEGKTTEEIEAEIQAANEAAKALTTLEKAAQGDADAFTEVETAVNNATEAIKAMADHAQGVHDKITGTLDGVAKGFEKIETPMMANARTTKDLTDKIAGLDSKSKTYADDLAKLNEEMAKSNKEKISAQSMGANLKQQAEWMDEYLQNLRKARQMGVDENILAQLADGSAESFDYLAAIAEASPDEVRVINENWQKVIDAKNELSDELTAQQLTVDDVYQNLAAEAKKAVAELDLEQEATTNAGKTVAGMAKGISGKVPELQTAVDEVCAQLSRLEDWGINLTLGGFGSIGFGSGATGSEREKNGVTYYSHANGLDYVPFDNYFARLHEGEAVLTAEENKIWQRYRNGSLTGVDYDQLGGVMRDNVKAGGNVYLDGRIVGNVISDRQGRSYRSLQRSGWQQ